MMRIITGTIPMVFVALLATACSDDSSDGGSGGTSGVGGSGGTSGVGGSGGTSGVGGGSAGGSSSCEGSPCDAPIEPGALLAFLQAGSYQSWDRESAAHASAGPHASSVRTYVSPKLGESLQNAVGSHPAGAATVKEFLDTSDKPTGWAVWVKVKSDSAGGQNLYWYETFDATTGTAAAEGLGVSICVNCHAQSAATDFFLSPFPLQ